MRARLGYHRPDDEDGFFFFSFLFRVFPSGLARSAFGDVWLFAGVRFGLPCRYGLYTLYIEHVPEKRDKSRSAVVRDKIIVTIHSARSAAGQSPVFETRTGITCVCPPSDVAPAIRIAGTGRSVAVRRLPRVLRSHCRIYMYWLSRQPNPNIAVVDIFNVTR